MAMRVENLKVGIRLGGGFGRVLAIFAAAVVVTTLLLNVVERESRQIGDESLPFLLTANEMDINATRVSEALTDVSATRDMEGLKMADEAAQSFREGSGKFKEMFRRENDMKALQEVEELDRSFEAYYDQGKRMAATYSSKGTAEGNKLMEEFDKTRERLLFSVQKFQNSRIDETKEAVQENIRCARKVKSVLLLLVAVGVALGAVVACFITRSITRPLAEGVSFANALAGGDLWTPSSRNSDPCRAKEKRLWPSRISRRFAST